MKNHYFVGGVLMFALLVLAGCGSTTVMQPVRFGPFTFQISDSYGIVAAATGSSISYRSDATGDQSLIQLAQARVDSGVTIDQMASLNLQKLEVSLPGYQFVEQSSRSIDCAGSHDGEMVSFITEQGSDKLFHSQYYTMIEGQGYVWSVSSTSDTTRKTLANIVKSAVCE